MDSLYAVGKMIAGLGMLLIIGGGLLMLVGKFTGLGRLPGDVLIQKGNFTFYFPIVTMIILSLVLTLILNLLFRR
ncbi:MAG: DUF2905 domain-containing protein [Firmicutes bacterium]|nr:DUF2905 domain-containing protein [Bacillota bacterium]